ncbi:hypothetical protein KPH14_004390 [Odynerus spinipes]|uniref:Uncharacterized protein n=1 Tax=Odynerus spinipes TaxID=1348599 RepID=A0AAD9VVC3_9HYME|nr:hypothetical protein KPH14_004390 [Odynerus spinipes]
MSFRVKTLFFTYIWIVANVLAENTTRSPEEENSKIFYESTEESFSQDEDFSTEAKFLISKDTHQNQAAAVAFESDSTNNTNEFKPSVHLGEIEEPRVKNNPFNKVHHVRFENNVDVRSHQPNFKNVKQSVLHDVVERQNGHVKFDDSADTYRSRKYQTLFPNQETIQPLQAETLGEQKVINDQSFLQNLDKPVYIEEHTAMIFDKPMRFSNEFQEHLPLGPAANLGDQKTLYLVPDYHLSNDQGNYHVEPQDPVYVNVQKPSNAVVYLTQQHEYTRMRKQPHYYYHQPVGYQEMDFLGEARPTVLYPKGQTRISPWKKIVHLIGAFLPLGLLLATLAPNVVKIENTTQPNIVLSKLRVVDLPIEHKQARFVEEQKNRVCEERSLCELILGGGKPRSNVMQNVLWNLAIR